MLKSWTQPTTMYKVKTHKNIDGDEQADNSQNMELKKKNRCQIIWVCIHYTVLLPKKHMA